MSVAKPINEIISRNEIRPLSMTHSVKLTHYGMHIELLVSMSNECCEQYFNLNNCLEVERAILKIHTEYVFNTVLSEINLFLVTGEWFEQENNSR